MDSEDRQSRDMGFTLIELLVVIAIIGILSTVALTSLAAARRKAQDAKRITELKEMQKAVELYFADHGAYPNTGASWRGECALWGSYAQTDVIPGLVPTYLAALPQDPDMDKAGSRYCFLYSSNGTDYAIMDIGWGSAAVPDPDPKIGFGGQPSLIDPVRDGGSNACAVDGTSVRSWKVASPGAVCW